MTQPATCAACVDNPTLCASVDPLYFPVEGWIWLGEDQSRLLAVEAWSGDVKLGQTYTLRPRPDVSKSFALAEGALTGFHFFAHHPAGCGRSFDVQIRAQLRDGTQTGVLFSCRVTGIDRDYRRADYGIMLDRATTAIQRRPNIYTSGPSLAEGSGHLAGLIQLHLGPPPKRVIDVGCGLGFYGRMLRAKGYDWFGVEMKSEDCARLAAEGLPHTQVDGVSLPFADGSFDAAMCIEVLEHIENPERFLAEVSRVAPKQLVVSVPNCELLSYLSTYLAVPWHMLEADHKNFFTRWSLEALLKRFYPHVEVGFHSEHPLRTQEGAPLHYQLLAIGRS